MAGWPTLVVVVALALFAAVSNAETQGKMMTKISTSFFSILATTTTTEPKTEFFLVSVSFETSNSIRLDNDWSFDCSIFFWFV
jgi:hypothetical protein